MNSRTLPDWLTKKEEIDFDHTGARSAGKPSFIEKTLVGIESLLEEAIFSEQYARREAFLQKLDPRVKVVSFLALLVAVALARHVEIIIALYLFTLALAYFSDIPLGFFLKRVWLFIPIFTGVIAFPALFNVVTPGKPLVTVGSLAITEQGVRTAVLLISRVATSVSFAVLLVLTTRWQSIMRALRVFYVPQTFIVILEITYRYIFLFLKTISEMHLARKSRTIRPLKSVEGRAWIASRVATLFRKSQHLSEGVYLAMLSRGFNGEAKTLSVFRVGVVDYLWGSFTIGLFVATLWLNYRLV
ncbi:MAG: cobalt ECF transporter T component CbiQ [Actinomycetota bacterium]